MSQERQPPDQIPFCEKLWTLPVNGVSNPNYGYDGNGNQTSGGGRTVAYTSFNMTSRIVQGTTTVTLSYDAEHARVKMTEGTAVTTYLNDPASGATSEKSVTGGVTTWRDYLMADGRIVAERFSGATTAVRYFVTDHLGSVAVATDESGAVVERDAYDAWGKRRDAATAAEDTSCSLPGASVTTRGFTGHEQLASTCLVNANARIYDPAVGRFLAPDSMIPDPLDSQSFNRYTYVRNRPLSATDPTGHTGEAIDETAWGHGNRYDDGSLTLTGLGAEYFRNDVLSSQMGSLKSSIDMGLAGGATSAPSSLQKSAAVHMARLGTSGVQGARQYKLTWTVQNADGSTTTASQIVAGDEDADGTVHIMPLGEPTFGGGEIGSQEGGDARGIDANSGNGMSLSQKGIDFIKKHEGFSSTVYNDSAGNPTIGYGHLIKKGEDYSNGINEQEAEKLLSKDLQNAVDAVNKKIEVKLSQNQFDALVDFTYNVGINNFSKSTLLSNINSVNKITMSNFIDWKYAGGMILQGLIRRRTDEYNLYSK